MRDGVTIRMHQADLAQLAGTSRESVSRFLADAGAGGGGAGAAAAASPILEPERLGYYIF